MVVEYHCYHYNKLISNPQSLSLTEQKETTRAQSFKVKMEKTCHFITLRMQEAAYDTWAESGQDQFKLLCVIRATSLNYLFSNY